MNVQLQIVTWNSANNLPIFFKGLRQQTQKPFRICAIDNGSNDATLQILAGESDVLVTQLGKNTGFAHAHNVGFTQAINAKDIDIVVIINSDVLLEKNAIKIISSYLAKHPQTGTISGKLMRPNALTNESKIGIIDSAGIDCSYGFRFVNRAENKKDSKTYSKTISVIANSGACLALPISSIVQLSLRKNKLNFEVFDEQFFAYKEDVDLGLRAKKLQLENICLGDVIGTHKRHVKSGYVLREIGSLQSYLSIRNHWFLLLRHFSFSKHVWDIPGIFIIELIKLFLFIFMRPRDIPKLYSEIKKFKKNYSHLT